MAISCDPNALLDASKCFKCIPSGTQSEVMIYLLQQIAGNTETTDQLMDHSKCYKCIPAGMQPEVITYLLCQIANAVGA